MGRLSLYLLGIYGLAAAYLVYLDRHAHARTANHGIGSAPDTHVPVEKAADLLRQAWADHHTVA
jgi:hypothetical protein